MNTSAQLEQEQERLIEQMRRIHVMYRGTLSEQEYPARRARRGGDGAAGPYFLWQGSIDGKHFSRRVGAEEAKRIRAGIEARHRFEQLCTQYVELGQALAVQTQGVQETQDALKKTLKLPSKRTRK
jgi:hypothetical protein